MPAANLFPISLCLEKNIFVAFCDVTDDEATLGKALSDFAFGEEMKDCKISKEGFLEKVLIG